MVVAVSGSWKLPIGYFFIAHLNADEKSCLVVTALQKLYDVGIRVVSITCDCLAANWSTLKKLGAVIDLQNLKAWFPHPSNPDLKVYLVLDPSHLIKLIRNALSDLEVILDADGNQIRYMSYC